MDADQSTVDDDRAQGEVQRHPIRGALWGIPMGIGLSLFLVGQKVISLGTWPPVLVFLVGPVIGVAWAWFAPPKEAESEAREDESGADGDGEDEEGVDRA